MASAASISADRNRGLALLMGGAMLAGALLLMAQIMTAFSAFAARPGPADSLVLGTWLAEDLAGGGVIDRAQTTLSISPDGAVSGSGGCNRYRATATTSGAAISLGPLVATRMACPPALMNQEAKFFGILAAARGWRVDAARRKLELMDGAGIVLARFSSL